LGNWLPFASRGAVVAGNAIHSAAPLCAKKILELASKVFGNARNELELDDGMVRVAEFPTNPLAWVNWRLLAKSPAGGSPTRAQNLVGSHVLLWSSIWGYGFWNSCH